MVSVCLIYLVGVFATYFVIYSTQRDEKASQRVAIAVLWPAVLFLVAIGIFLNLLLSIANLMNPFINLSLKVKH